MASCKVLLYALLGLCLVSIALSAAVEYQEPDIEAITSSEDKTDREEGASEEDDGSREDPPEDEEMSGDSKNNDGIDKEESSGDSEENKDEDAEVEESSGDMDEKQMKKEDTMKKIDAVEEEKSAEKDGSSSSSEEVEGGSSSSEEEPGMLTKCSSGIEGITALVNAVNGTESKDCPMTKVLQSMVELLQTLSLDVKELKGQVAKTTCSGGKTDGSKDEDSDESEEEEGSGKKEENMTAKSSEEEEGSGDEEGKEEDENSKNDGNKKKKCNEGDEEEAIEESTTEAVTEPTTKAPTTPPPPAACPPPFQLLARSCYYIQTDQREWRSWGEAHSFCQQQGGTLAAPYGAQDLRDYLKQTYSNSFWVGARLLDGQWQWMTGRTLVEDDWRQNRPHKHPSQRCVYIDSFYGYKGSNYFCGEKFSFICEHRGV